MRVRESLHRNYKGLYGCLIIDLWACRKYKALCQRSGPKTIADMAYGIQDGVKSSAAEIEASVVKFCAFFLKFP